MIYFIQEAGNPNAPIKIGYTAGRPEARLSSLQTGSPLRLKLLCVRDGRQVDERKLHEQWKHLRLHGEWFRAAAELVEFIGLEQPPASTVDEDEEDDEDHGPPPGDCPSLRLDYLRQERHRTQVEAIGILGFLYPDCGPLKALADRRRCPRCWKWCWMFESTELLYVVWDGWPPKENDDIGVGLSCVDIFSAIDRERAFRPRVGCGYDFPGRRLAL